MTVLAVSAAYDLLLFQRLGPRQIVLLLMGKVRKLTAYMQVLDFKICGYRVDFVVK